TSRRSATARVTGTAGRPGGEEARCGSEPATRYQYKPPPARMTKATPTATMRRRRGVAPPKLLTMEHLLRRGCRALFLSFGFDHYMGWPPFFEAYRERLTGRGRACPGQPDHFRSVPSRSGSPGQARQRPGRRFKATEIHSSGGSYVVSKRCRQRPKALRP